jgi:hypothetical protein
MDYPIWVTHRQTPMAYGHRIVAQCVFREFMPMPAARRRDRICETVLTEAHADLLTRRASRLLGTWRGQAVSKAIKA